VYRRLLGSPFGGTLATTVVAVLAVPAGVVVDGAQGLYGVGCRLVGGSRLSNGFEGTSACLGTRWDGGYVRTAPLLSYCATTRCRSYL
jgi:hypothetical protein